MLVEGEQEEEQENKWLKKEYLYLLDFLVGLGNSMTLTYRDYLWVFFLLRLLNELEEWIANPWEKWGKILGNHPLDHESFNIKIQFSLISVTES